MGQSLHVQHEERLCLQKPLKCGAARNHAGVVFLPETAKKSHGGEGSGNTECETAEKLDLLISVIS